MTGQEVLRPWIREEVINALRDISVGDPAKWMQDDPVEIDYVVHLFFDDNDLVTNPDSLIGDVLMGPAESDAIKQFAFALDNLISELGDSNTKDYYTHPNWPDVRRHASSAYSKIIENENQAR